MTNSVLAQAGREKGNVESMLEKPVGDETEYEVYVYRKRPDGSTQTLYNTTVRAVSREAAGTAVIATIQVEAKSRAEIRAELLSIPEVFDSVSAGNERCVKCGKGPHYGMASHLRFFCNACFTEEFSTNRSRQSLDGV